MQTIVNLLALQEGFVAMAQPDAISTAIYFEKTDDGPWDIEVSQFTPYRFQRLAIQAGKLLSEIPELVRQISPEAMAAPNPAQNWFRLLLDFRPEMILWKGESYPAWKVPPASIGLRRTGALHYGAGCSTALIEKLALMWEEQGGDKRQTKSRHRKRANRAADIESITNEMIHHLLAARDHAHSTKDFGGQPMLLPRPRKKDLALRTKLDPTKVSRCMNDESARELRILWDLALDLDQVMEFVPLRKPIKEGCMQLH